MAQSISDVFARGERLEGEGRRTARFLEPEKAASGQAESDDSPITTVLLKGESTLRRRAAFRPAETVALRRDVVEAFAAAMLRDGEISRGEEKGRGILYAAVAAESLGDFELAFQRLREFEEGGGKRDWAAGQIHRRVLRGLQAEDLLGRALKEAGELEGAPQGAGLYAGLERADLGWRGGDEPLRVIRRCDRALRTMIAGGKVDAFAMLWLMQLRCDAALEAGEAELALEGLKEAAARPEIVVETRQALEARRAVWLHIYGRHEEARSLLGELAGRGALPGDLDDLLINLHFEAGDVGQAFAVLRSTARDSSRLKTHALPLVMLHDGQKDNPTGGHDILREATEDCDDWTLLRLREQLLDAAIDEQGRAAGKELIEVLNRRLEGPLSEDERVSTLTRLGRYYEMEAGLEEAAAEVYREALSYDPQHVPALRALGRLYTRRENWRGLAELYEREIASIEMRPGGWRRHFQLGELYEHRLGKDERALENYLLVLDVHPNYLPALKSSARILGRLQRWTRLADLFLRLVDTATSRRQKLYLLDKVAEVAELRLENFEVAIGAWKEILDLDPENPRAFTALGRLYARTRRWNDLIGLNEEEIELINDAEEIAAVLLRNAEIAEQNLDDAERAERYYRRALNVIPDYLPALEALGRIYLRGGRWAEIVKMTGRELRALDAPEKATRQLGALAEILETHLDRREDAIGIYEELFALDPTDGHIFSTLGRLYRGEQDWERLQALIVKRLEQGPGQDEYASLQGELGVLAEWRMGAPERAFGRYLAALQSDPTDLHWLGGVARTWPAAGVAPSEVADQLEDLLMHARGAQTRDRYFVIIARLRERAEGGPQASRAYRAHGDPSSLENQIVLRMAMATAGERRSLVEARQALPHHPLQRIIVLDRRAEESAAAQDLSAEAHFLPPAAKAWFAGELPPKVAACLEAPKTLSVDLVHVLEGQELFEEDVDGVEARERMRLRALQARRRGDDEAYQRWTRQEIQHSGPIGRAARLLELARYASKRELLRRDQIFAEACRAIYPELAIDESGAEVGASQIELSFSPPPIPDGLVEELYGALRETKRYRWLRHCLEAQVARSSISKERRLEIFVELAALLRDELEDFEGARDALVHCWQLSEAPGFLREIVELSQAQGRREEALRFQRSHFERVSMTPDVAVAERLQSGIWLAELLMQGDSAEERVAAIECLEALTAEPVDAEGWRQARRLLAKAHASARNGQRAAEILEDVLHFQVRREEREDWRLLVDLYRHQLGDAIGAYTRQWSIVRACPHSQVDLDMLVDLAAEADELADCVEQLSTLASASTDGAKATLIARAAEAADEELGHAEEAFRLFEKVLELIDEDDEKRTYYERRRAICLSRMAGREARALEAFRALIHSDPFEPTTYRGLETLFDRANALDRLRITRQALRTLGCDAQPSTVRGKNHATRTLASAVVESTLLPSGLDRGVLEILREVMPLAEKVWADELPQRKAFDGRRIRSGEEHPFYDDLQAALFAFGISKFRLQIGESGPEQPVVFCGATPMVWIHEALLEDLKEAKSRFIAGYCAALVWSDVAALQALDGRQVWHLLEGAVYRQNGAGFSDRVDQQSQQMAEVISGPFDAKARRRVVQAVEECDSSLLDVHCEAWGRQLEGFAARAGLLLSGDLEAAVAVLLRLSGWRLPLDAEATQRRLRNDAAVEDLFNLAHSDAILELRYQLGLAGRPSRLKI